jgi:signal transduction histidine kinase
MKRLNILIIVFGIALVLPLSWLIFQAYNSLRQEEIAQLRFFSTELFAQMEEALAQKIYREEGRAVDAYQTEPDSPLSTTSKYSEAFSSYLAKPPQEPYILGYFQNNPDGSFQSPYKLSASTTSKKNAFIRRLESINSVFNQKKYQLPEHPAPAARPVASTSAKTTDSFAEKYLKRPQIKSQRSYLGSKAKRTEAITPSQAINLSQNKITLNDKDKPSDDEAEALKNSFPKREHANESAMDMATAPPAEEQASGVASDRLTSKDLSVKKESEALKVEVTPFQMVEIDPDTLFIFRRVILQNQVYRQGFVVALTPFINYMAKTFFLAQPMAEFTQLTFSFTNDSKRQFKKQFGPLVKTPNFRLDQTFPAPFNFLNTSLTCQKIPASAARSTLNWIVIALSGVVLIGFFSIYKAVRSVVDLSERRARFVSSVTHELKTPLTNISLYIEMLEEGIAQDKAKEEAYYHILSTESARLSRLIGNVLELSRLEKKQRRFDLKKGTFDEVIDEVRTLFSAKLRQENYTLTLNSKVTQPFCYDREIMIQVLINLIENSLKFGQDASERDIVIATHQKDDKTYIAVSDHGPGIPRKALKKVFDDFYRVQESQDKTISGTGIGLALVKKFITAMGGQVTAENRSKGPGCIITISMPLGPV